MMQRYWDLTECARSELTEDEVKSYLGVELMEQGILKVPDLKLLKVPDVDIGEGTTFYEIEHQAEYSYKQTLDVLFESAVDADAFISMTVFGKETDYNIGSQYSFAKGRTGMTIKPVTIHTEQQIANQKAVLEEAKTKTEENEKRKAEHTKACKVMNDAVSGIWADWHKCLQLATEHQRIVDTEKEYMDLSGGDPAVAEKFLEKAFTKTAIKAARVWFRKKEKQQEGEVG